MVSIDAQSRNAEASRRAFDSPALHWDCQHNTARPAVCMTSPLSVRQLLWAECQRLRERVAELEERIAALGRVPR